MIQLEPCPHCQRHVRVSEPTCPFCRREIAAAMQSARPRPLPQTRLGRAALFAFGVTVGAAGVDGCADDGDDSDEHEEESNEMAIYGAPAPPDDEDDGSDSGGAGDAAGRRDGGAVSAPADAGKVEPRPSDAGTPPAAGKPDASSAGEDAGSAGKPDAGSTGKPDAGADASARDAGRVRDAGGIIALYGLPPAPPVDAPVPIYGAPEQPKPSR